MKRAVVRSKRQQASKGAKQKVPRRQPLSRKPKAAAKLKAKLPQPARSSAKPKVARKSVVRRKAKLVKSPAAVTKQPPVARRKPVVAVITVKLSASVARKKASPQKISRNRQPEIPPILLEGDEMEFHPTSGPGEKFVLGPAEAAEHFTAESAELPASYGTHRLFLTARDPHWLYAHWDLSTREQFRHNARSVDRHLILRLHTSQEATKPVTEIHVHPESRYWFAHVEQAGQEYTAELGYYEPRQRWHSLLTSAPMRTPPDNISADTKIEFATIPSELSFETMLALLKQTAGPAVAKTLPLAQAIDKIRPQFESILPKALPIPEWTRTQELALNDILVADQSGIAPPNSKEFVEGNIGLVDTTELVSHAAPTTSYVSSFFGGEAQADFWFNLNAELIVYGATEPNAVVTVAGKRIPLRPDGSFSFRFAFPDGQFALPLVAVAADGTDARAAELKFNRATQVSGHVGTHPQSSSLRPPTPDDI